MLDVIVAAMPCARYERTIRGRAILRMDTSFEDYSYRSRRSMP